jgi:hypothetical protein
MARSRTDVLFGHDTDRIRASSSVFRASRCGQKPRQLLEKSHLAPYSVESIMITSGKHQEALGREHTNSQATFTDFDHFLLTTLMVYFLWYRGKEPLALASFLHRPDRLVRQMWIIWRQFLAPITSKVSSISLQQAGLRDNLAIERLVPTNSPLST